MAITGRKAPRGDEAQAADVKARLQALREDPAFRDHPLLKELERMAEAHLRLLGRMAKITRISDGFQAQMKALNESLQRVSRTDALTEIANRRAMMEEVGAERLRSIRGGTPMAVVMADVDLFKGINDTFGHEAGDRVLHGLGQALKGALRAYDVCGRWGGEEFLVLLPGTDREGAEEVAEKLRKAVADLRIPAGDKEISVRMSLGIAVLDGHEPLDALLRRADEAMYEAKRMGGDRVEG